MTADGITAAPSSPKSLNRGNVAGVATAPHSRGIEPTAPEGSARPASPSLPGWGWALVVAVGLLLLIGWRVEVAAAARLLPPPAARFSSGQPVTVPLAAGDTRTVYWDFQNVRRGARATALCRAVDAQSKAELPLQKVGGDLRVNKTPW